MKNSKLRSVLFSLVLFASIGSYLYINSIKVNDCTVKCEKTQQQLLDSEGSSDTAELPDVKLFKKLVEKGKELMPSTQL